MLRLLVTGAAGLIGGNVCARLAAGGHSVTALVHRERMVRGNDGGIVCPVRTVGIDVTADRLGLDGDTYASLAAEHDLVVHCAALTRFDQPEADYLATNVQGTANIVALARAGAMGLVYVSTAYVCGARQGQVRETEPLPATGFANAYEASKARAETLVRTSGIPFVIARPSIVTGESLSGAIRDFDTTYAVFRLIAQGRIRSLPCSAGATLDFVPIDHVAAGLVTLVERFGQARGRTCHLTSGDPVTVAQFVAAIGAFAQFHPPRLVAAEQFDPASLPIAERRLYARMAGPYASYFARDPRFDDAVFRALGGAACAPTGPAYLDRLIRYCITRGFLPDAPAAGNRLSARPDSDGRAAGALRTPTSPRP